MKLLILIIFGSYSLVFASPTNLEVIINSIDSIAIKSEPMIFKKSIKIQSEFQELVDRIESSYKNLDSNYVVTNSNQYGASISLDSIQINYNESDGTRTIKLIANLQSLADDNIVSYQIPVLYSDTIEVENISRIEDESFPFTKGNLLEESSIWNDVLEPVVFVGSSAIIIYLLFTVRSG